MPGRQAEVFDPKATSRGRSYMAGKQTVDAAKNYVGCASNVLLILLDIILSRRSQGRARPKERKPAGCLRRVFLIRERMISVDLPQGRQNTIRYTLIMQSDSHALD